MPPLDTCSLYITHIQGKTVRLPSEYLQIIQDAFRETFDPTDHLWIFGSRMDPQKRGGDIDLYIEARDTKKAYEAKNRLWLHLQKRLGEQKIDIVLNTHTTHLPIYDIARKEGIQLL